MPFKESGLFVVSRYGVTNWHNYNFYHSHGEFRGVKDVMSYTNMERAKKFSTHEEAERFIVTELPEPEKARHRAVKVSPIDILILCPSEYIKLLEQETKNECSQQYPEPRQ